MKRKDFFEIIENIPLKDQDFILKLRPRTTGLKEILPGQFVQVLVPHSNDTFLRRPISVCDVDEKERLLILYMKKVGKGTKQLSLCKIGEEIDILYPLGNGFDYSHTQKPLLLGGGVGIAPMVYLAKKMVEKGIIPTVLLAGKTAESLTIRSFFQNERLKPNHEHGYKSNNEHGCEADCHLHLCTDDGSLGEKGIITQHSIMQRLNEFDTLYCCGPTPMMKAVARMAETAKIPCYVSLENMMACGLGACLCCVTPTKEHGNQCVCTEGPVFDSRELAW